MKKRTSTLLLSIALSAGGVTALLATPTVDWVDKNVVSRQTPVVASPYAGSLVFKDTYTRAQGGASDGTYFYYAFTPSNGEQYYLRKVSLETGKVVLVNLKNSYHHANDICYNPDTGKLYVVNMDGKGTISVVNPQTLAFERNFSLYALFNNDIASLSYDAQYQRYVVHPHHCYDDNRVTPKYYAVLDREFTLIDTYMLPNNGLTSQGLDCDNQYIYMAYCKKNNLVYTNYLIVYDWFGNFVTSDIIGKSTLREIESVTLVAPDTFYCMFSGGTLPNVLYRYRADY